MPGEYLRVTALFANYMVDREQEQQKCAPCNPKNNAAAGYQGPVKIKLLKGAGLLLKILSILLMYFARRWWGGGGGGGRLRYSKAYKIQKSLAGMDLQS